MKRKILQFMITISSLLCLTFGVFGCSGFCTQKTDLQIVGNNLLTENSSYNVNGKIAVSSVSLDRAEIYLEINRSKKLNVTVFPADATHKDVIWTSDDTGVVTVSNGVIFGVAVGSANVTVTSKDGCETATCTVNVREPGIYVQEIILNKRIIQMDVKDTAILTATVIPADATNKTVVWESADSTVATVVDGVVTAVSGGTVAIMAKSEYGDIISYCYVAVAMDIPVIKVSQIQAEIRKGDTVSIYAELFYRGEKVQPEYMTWTSDNIGLVTVENGRLTAVGYDGSKAKVTVVAEYRGLKTAVSIDVTVKNIVE